MITQQEAEYLAQMSMQEYVKSCECNSPLDVGNSLIKMVMMCGLGLCATVGQKEAVSMLMAATSYIERSNEGRDWTCRKSN